MSRFVYFQNFVEL